MKSIPLELASFSATATVKFPSQDNSTISAVVLPKTRLLAISGV